MTASDVSSDPSNLFRERDHLQREVVGLRHQLAATETALTTACLRITWLEAEHAKAGKELAEHRRAFDLLRAALATAPK